MTNRLFQRYPRIPVVPLRHTCTSEMASGEMLKLIVEACIFRPQLVASFVLNRCGARTIIGFADAARSGRLVNEIDDDGPAPREIASLTAEIERLMR